MTENKTFVQVSRWEDLMELVRTSSEISARWVAAALMKQICDGMSHEECDEAAAQTISIDINGEWLTINGKPFFRVVLKALDP